jgi:hypothetical protein
VTAGAGNDSLVDSPTSYGTDTGVGGTVRGNYCTWNPLSTGGGVVLSNGNLRFSKTSSTCIGAGTIFVSSGKWYAEYTCTSSVNMVGVIRDTDSPRSMDYVGFSANSYGYYYNGNKFNNNTNAGYGSSYTTNDVIGIALDMDAGTIAFYKNGTSQGTAYSGLSGNFTVASGDNVSVSGELNTGQRPFAYTAPSGFKALCTQNLPTPTIGVTTATTANKFFDVSLWTGNGSSQSITNGGFQPDWVWTKSRSVSQDSRLVDVLRGVSKALYSQLTIQEATESTGITSFNASGFSVGSGSSNTNAVTYVGWQWKANGTGVTNTSGSITSTVSANTTSGFSVVTYTGVAADSTVGHGLGVAPSMIIAKSKTNSGTNWVVYHTSLGINKTMIFTSSGEIGITGYWGTANPTSTVFGVKNGYDNNAGNMVAYCFAPVAGYSAFGTYTGNLSTDGPFVFCGFRPRFVMIKRSDGGVGNWQMYDTSANPYNVVGNYQTANLSNAEEYYLSLDILSNGFKLRNVDTGINGSGNTYIYACFAENPFKYSLAR